MLGIEGGISILGTTGIVEPMSEAAIVATIETSIRQALVMEEAASAGPRRILAVPGNYGRRYAEEYLRLDPAGMVEVSNHIGEAIDLSISYGAAAFLLIGNVGKLVKLAAGIMNTHSRMADGRWEIFAAHLALCGGSRDEVQAIREAPTTEEMLTRLEEMGRRIPVMRSIMQSIEQHMAHRIGESCASVFWCIRNASDWSEARKERKRFFLCFARKKGNVDKGNHLFCCYIREQGIGY